MAIGNAQHRQAVDEVTELYEQYERDLLHNRVDAMDAVFWDDGAVVRFGINELQFGIESIRTWRRDAHPVPQSRRITRREILALSDDVVTVDVTFVNGEAPGVGRQSQVWCRVDDGWRIVRAHVSMI
jgi:hypothetical protein